MSRSGEPNPTGRRALRWALWLVGGATAGMLAGFVAGLSRPREDFSVRGQQAS
ncbi:hypothetical protein [Microlunatus elymi]|uniref:hypothetical protein n=1 Tax=Microlunatus elymi TaxID=2596828 RepID=UPI00143CD801|nr:hypothetical protein [Microlunatus elymi]